MADFQVQTIGRNYQKKTFSIATARVTLADLRERTGNSSLTLGTTDKVALFTLPGGSLVTNVYGINHAAVAINNATLGDGTDADRFVDGTNFDIASGAGNTVVDASNVFIAGDTTVYWTPGEAVSNAAMDFTVVAEFVETEKASGTGLLQVPEGSVQPVSP